MPKPNQEWRSLEGARYVKVAEAIDGMIRRKVWRYGEKLPSTAALAKQFDITTPTMQRSLARLVRRGLIKRTRCKGTHVTFGGDAAGTAGIVFGKSPHRIESPYYLLLIEAIRAAAAAMEVPVKFYLDINEADYGRTIREVERDIAAGEVTSIVPVHESTMLLEWISGDEVGARVVPLPLIDLAESARLGVAHLVERGFRRIGFISMVSDAFPRIRGLEEEGIARALAGHADVDLHTHAGGLRAQDGYDRARDLVAAGLPEAVFSHHDLSTIGLLQHLAEAGVRIPDHLALLTHANTGSTFLSRIPLTRVELDPRTIAMCLMWRLGAARARALTGLDVERVAPRLVLGDSCPMART